MVMLICAMSQMVPFKFMVECTHGFRDLVAICVESPGNQYWRQNGGGLLPNL